MTDTTLLRPAGQFPAPTVARPGGSTLCLPDDLAGHFGVILFYRWSWCPYCNTKLSAFQHAPDCLADIGALVAAVPVDDEATTQDLVDRHGLRIPVGHSADARAIAAARAAELREQRAGHQDRASAGTGPRTSQQVAEQRMSAVTPDGCAVGELTRGSCAQLTGAGTRGRARPPFGAGREVKVGEACECPDQAVLSWRPAW
jgi:peroxiredoxin